MAKPLRALIVEDSEDDALLAKLELRRAGYDVTAQRVETEEAMRKALESEWDVVLSDYAMPSFDGIRAFQVARKMGIDAPFIIVSETMGEETAVEAMRAGVSDYVLKGNLRRLVSAVERGLKHREEQRQAQEQLAASEARLDAVMKQLPAVVWTTNSKLRVTSVMGSGAALGGAAGGASRGTIVDYLRAPAPGDPAIRAHRRALCGETVKYDFRAEGRLFEAQASPLRDESGSIAGVVGVGLDVTDREELRRQLAVSQRMESVGRLAGGIAHDFNNVLSVVTSYAGFLLEDLEPETPMHEDVGQIRDAARRATRLVKQLLAFSRRQVLEQEVFDLNVAVTDLQKMLRRLIGEDVELVARTSSVVSPIRADRGQVEQILMNLAVNARDAMPGGGRVEIGIHPATLPDDVLRGSAVELPPGRYARLSVADTGMGIAPDTLPHIFEPFFTTKDGGRGTGLGLATVYGIVKQSGGDIHVESTVGEGTTFSIYLPLVDATPRASSRPAPPTSLRGTERILIVEDDPIVRRTVHRLLERRGYHVVSVPGGQEALDHCDREAIDVLLADVVMPGMSGDELGEHVRGMRPGTRIIFMSGYTDETLARYRLGEATLLAKPFMPDELLRKLREVLDDSPNRS